MNTFGMIHQSYSAITHAHFMYITANTGGYYQIKYLFFFHFLERQSHEMVMVKQDIFEVNKKMRV